MTGSHFLRRQFQAIKTKEARKVPLCKELHKLLQQGFSFVTYENTSYYFNKGIKKAGLLEEKRKRGRRFVIFHDDKPYRVLHSIFECRAKHRCLLCNIHVA